MPEVSVRAVGNSVEARVRVGKRQISRSAPTEEEALRRLEAALWKMGSPMEPTVSKYVKLYLQSVEDRLRTNRVSKQHLDQARWALGYFNDQKKEYVPGYFEHILDRDVASIKKSELQQFFNRLDKSPATLKHLRKHLRAVFKIAYDDEDIPRNPVDGVTLPAVGERTVEVLEPGELRMLIDASRGYAPHPFVVLGSLLCVGPGEVAKITPSCIKGDGTIHIPGTKNKYRDRILPLPARIRDELEGYDPPFKYHRSNLAARLRETAFRAQLMKEFSPYVLRHSCATGMRKIGVPDHAIDLFLGHSPQGMRKKYTHDDALDNAHWAEDWCDHVYG